MAHQTFKQMQKLGIRPLHPCSMMWKIKPLLFLGPRPEETQADGATPLGFEEGRAG